MFVRFVIHIKFLSALQLYIVNKKGTGINDPSPLNFVDESRLI